MSVRIMSLVWDANIGSANTKLVAMKLADNADDLGGSVFPAKSTISTKAEVSTATVYRAIRLFLKKGLLTVVTEGGKGPRSTTEYAFNLDVLNRLSDGSTSLPELPDAVPETPPDAVPDEGAKAVTVTPLEDEKRLSPDTNKAVTVTQKGCQALTDKPSGNRQEPSGVVAKRNTALPDFDQLEAKLREAGGDALNDASPGLFKMVSPMAWLDRGADLDRDIVPAIRARAKTCRARSIRSWTYFDEVIEEWMRAKAGASSGAKGEGGGLEPSKFSDDDWRKRLDYRNRTGTWSDQWGPAPGEPRCRVPEHLLAQQEDCTI